MRPLPLPPPPRSGPAARSPQVPGPPPTPLGCGPHPSPPCLQPVQPSSDLPGPGLPSRRLVLSWNPAGGAGGGGPPRGMEGPVLRPARISRANGRPGASGEERWRLRRPRAPALADPRAPVPCSSSRSPPPPHPEIARDTWRPWLPPGAGAGPRGEAEGPPFARPSAGPGARRWPRGWGSGPLWLPGCESGSCLGRASGAPRAMGVLPVSPGGWGGGRQAGGTRGRYLPVLEGCMHGSGTRAQARCTCTPALFQFLFPDRGWSASSWPEQPKLSPGWF